MCIQIKFQILFVLGKSEILAKLKFLLKIISFININEEFIINLSFILFKIFDEIKGKIFNNCF